MKKQFTSTKGDSNGTIDSLIEFLNKAKDKGATHYNMYWSNDPHWAFKWFETYKELTKDEIKQREIEELENKLKELKG